MLIPDISAVIFDMDGTIFDTERLSTQGWREAGKQLEYLLTEEVITSFRGNNNEVISQKLIAYGYSPEMAAQAWKLRDAYTRKYVTENGVPVKPGLSRLLSFLRDRGYRTALSTGSSKDRALWLCGLAGLSDAFDVWVFGDELTKSKPDPEPFLVTARKLKTAPENCLVVEDSFNGVRAADAAKMPVIMIPDEDTPTEEIRSMCNAVGTALDEICVWLS